MNGVWTISSQRPRCGPTVTDIHPPTLDGITCVYISTCYRNIVSVRRHLSQTYYLAAPIISDTNCVICRIKTCSRDSSPTATYCRSRRNIIRSKIDTPNGVHGLKKIYESQNITPLKLEEPSLSGLPITGLDSILSPIER